MTSRTFSNIEQNLQRRVFTILAMYRIALFYLKFVYNAISEEVVVPHVTHCDYVFLFDIYQRFSVYFGVTFN